MIIFTSILSNYLSRSLALAESVLQFHPDADFRIYLLDYADAQIPTTQWLRSHLHLPLNSNLPTFLNSLEYVNPKVQLCERFNVIEACTAVKPFITQNLLNEKKHIVYLDPDIILYSPLEISSEEDWDMQLTPHTLKPAEKGNNTLLSERLFSNFGIFNLGYLAIKPSISSTNFINWWVKSCDLFGVANTSAGLYVDQKFFDFAPVFIENLSIVKDPGCNVAWWNIFCDGRQLAEDGKTVLYRDKLYPLKFFHFSNLDAADKINPFVAKPLKELGAPNEEIFELRKHPLLEKLISAYFSRINSLDQDLPHQTHLAVRLVAEQSFSEKLKRRCNDEIYRINAINNTTSSNLSLNHSKYTSDALPQTLNQSIQQLLPKLFKSAQLKQHFLRSWRKYLNNFMSPSLFYYISF